MLGLTIQLPKVNLGAFDFKPQENGRPAPSNWRDWLPHLFPSYFSAKFADRHVEFWEWLTAVELGVKPRPFVAIWGRGGAKSTNAEAAAVWVGAHDTRRYLWYISETQDQADEHVANIGAMLEASSVEAHYPRLAAREVGKYGSTKGWRRNRLRTASGLTVDALSPRDIGRLWEKLAWLGASVSRTGVSVQIIAAFDVALWDLKARSAGAPIGKLLGAYRDSVPCYNTSGGYLSASTAEVLANVDASLARGHGGIKLKVGQPELKKDLERVAAVREHVSDDVPVMVDANQQWDFTNALRAGRVLDRFGLVWLEEPLGAYDYRGHAQLKDKLDTPIATGEMLGSVAECGELIRHDSA